MGAREIEFARESPSP